MAPTPGKVRPTARNSSSRSRCCQSHWIIICDRNRTTLVATAAGWVWCQVGRAHFEMVDYPQAAAAFEQARRLEPHRLEVRARRERMSVPAALTHLYVLL